MSEPRIMKVAPPRDRPRGREDDADAPSFGALVAGLFCAVDGMVIGGTVLPGLLLCVPAILLVVVPILAVGALLLLVALVLAVAALPVFVVGKLLARHRGRLVPAVGMAKARRARVASPELLGSTLGVLAQARGDRDV